MLKTIIDRKPVYFFDSPEFQLNGKTCRIVGVETKRSGTTYTLRVGADLHDVEESAILNQLKKEHVEIPTVTLGQTLGRNKR